MSGIGIDINGDAKGFLRSAKQTEGALEDVADALDDLVKDAAKDGDKLGDGLEDGVKDGAKDAEKSVEKLERSFSELAASSKKESAKAGDDLGRNVKRGTDEAGEGLDEFKSEAASTARESAASFDGSADSIVGSFQEIAANAFAGFGPAGAVAGLAIAAGIGLATAASEKAVEDTQAFKEIVGELAAEFIETGGVAETSIDFMVDRLKAMATETEDGKDSLADLYKLAKTAGTSSFETLAKAYAGNADGLEDLIKLEEDHLDALRDKIAAEDAYNPTPGLTDEATARTKIVDKLKEAKTAAKEAADEEAAYVAAGGPELQLKADLIDSVSDAYDGVRDAAVDAATSDDGIFDIDMWIVQVAAHREQVEKYKSNLELLKFTSDQWANFLELPEEARTAIADSWANGDQATREAISMTLTDAGGAGGAGAQVAFDESFNPETDVDVAVTADTDAATADIKKVAGGDYEAKVKVTTNNKAVAKKEIDDVAKDRTAKIKVTLDKSDAERQLRDFVNKKRTITIGVTATRNGKEID